MASSLLQKHLTADLAAILADRRTATGVTLDDIARSGRLLLDSEIGVYAGDGETYDIFRELLDPIIMEYHGLSLPLQAPEPKAASSRVEAFGPGEDELVVSTRVRFARNIQGYRPPACMSSNERAAVEARVVEACLALPLMRRGRYLPLAGMDDALRMNLERRHLLFRTANPYLVAAGVAADWPANRGVALAGDGQLAVWVNEEDHVRVAALAPGSNLAEVYVTARALLDGLADQLAFQKSGRLGHLTSCPSNLGTGMRASLSLRLTRLALDGSGARLVTMVREAGLELRGSLGEGSAVEQGICEIGVRRRLGLSEGKILHTLREGTAMLLSEELREHRGGEGTVAAATRYG